MSIYLKIYFKTPSEADYFCHDYPQAEKHDSKVVMLRIPDGLTASLLLKPYDVNDYETFNVIEDRVDHEQ